METIEAMRIACRVILVIITVITCIGNSILLAAFIKTRNTRKKNKSLKDLIISLAVSDIFHGFIASPLFIAYLIVRGTSHDHRALEFFATLVIRYSLAVSMCTALAISVERYLAVVKPFWDPVECCKSAGKPLILTSTWLYPVIIMALLNYDKIHEPTEPEVGRWWELNDGVAGVHLFIIVTVTTTLYVIIYVTVIKTKKKVMQYSQKERKDSIKTTRTNSIASSTTSLGTSTPVRRAPSLHSYDIQLLKTLAITIGIFYISFIPTLISIPLGIAKLIDPVWLQFLDESNFIFLNMSPCLDPIIHIWRNAELKRTVRVMLCIKTESESASMPKMSHSSSNSLPGHDKKKSLEPIGEVSSVNDEGFEDGYTKKTQDCGGYMLLNNANPDGAKFILGYPTDVSSDPFENSYLVKSGSDSDVNVSMDTHETQMITDPDRTSKGDENTLTETNFSQEPGPDITDPENRQTEPNVGYSDDFLRLHSLQSDIDRAIKGIEALQSEVKTDS